jgi:hypothetical protein
MRNGTYTGVSVLLMTSAMLSSAGCSLWGPNSKGEAQFESTEMGPSMSLAGAYSDIGSDGSIKPHPKSTGETPEPKGGQVNGVIQLNMPVDMPDIRTGNSRVKGATGGTTSHPEFGSESTDGVSGK